MGRRSAGASASLWGFAAAALARDAGYEASFGEWTAYGGGLGGVFALAALAAGV